MILESHHLINENRQSDKGEALSAPKEKGSRVLLKAINIFWPLLIAHYKDFRGPVKK